MKRMKILSAQNGTTKIQVTIRAQSKGNDLTRDEMTVLIDSLTSRVMEAIPNARYLNVYLSEIQVK